MAALEFIDFEPFRNTISQDNEVVWERDPHHKVIKSLPIIFWSDGTPWNEANYWAHERATEGNVELKTVQGQMSHLHKYAEWLEIGRAHV